MCPLASIGGMLLHCLEAQMKSLNQLNLCLCWLDQVPLLLLVICGPKELEQAGARTALSKALNDSSVPKPEGAEVLTAQLSHMVPRSVVPNLGSFKPLSRGRWRCSSIVSGYSMWHTLMFLISSGGKSPNWISCTVFSGAELYGNLKFDILAGVSSEDAVESVVRLLQLRSCLLLSRAAGVRWLCALLALSWGFSSLLAATPFTSRAPSATHRRVSKRLPIHVRLPLS